MFFPGFYVFWNGAASSTWGGVWLLLATPPLLALPLTHFLFLNSINKCLPVFNLQESVLRGNVSTMKTCSSVFCNGGVSLYFRGPQRDRERDLQDSPYNSLAFSSYHPRIQFTGYWYKINQSHHFKGIWDECHVILPTRESSYKIVPVPN
jgi:hypothetical protein